MKQFEIENEFATGKVYLPEIENKTYQCIIIVSGSDGGIPGNNAIPEFFIQEIVNHGYAVFALAYFGYNNLPPSLENIPLEYFLNAITWFKSQDYINNNAVSIIGQSRGGELALILGTLIPNEFNAIVSIVPSDMLCGGFPHPNIPAWTYKDKSFSSFVGGLSNHDPSLTELQDLEEATKNGLIPYHKNTKDDPFIIADLFTARNKLDNFAVKIPVEKITSPILLLSGEDDAIWTSNQYCKNISPPDSIR